MGFAGFVGFAGFAKERKALPTFEGFVRSKGGDKGTDERCRGTDGGEGGVLVEKEVLNEQLLSFDIRGARLAQNACELSA